mmetsp:Transcript_18308/g.48755  ORF Transcript_18308/g.48755 Transcript_18308/m.48755 type:complete len:242 (-) Transcript_18308:411-1136(-)
MTQLSGHLVLAVLNRTTEDGREHIRDQVRHTDDDTFQRHQPFNVCGVHAAHDLAIFLEEGVHLHLACAQVLRLSLELTHGDTPQLAVEDWDDLGGEIDHVSIQSWGKLMNVLPTERELDTLLFLHALLPLPVQLLDVIGLISLSLRCPESPDEAQESIHDVHLIDVCSVQEGPLVNANAGTIISVVITRVRSCVRAVRCLGWRAQEAAVRRLGPSPRGCVGPCGRRAHLRPPPGRAFEPAV